MTRKEAKASGAGTYHGSPCKVCEKTERYTTSSNCRNCHLSADRKTWRRENYKSRKEAVRSRRLEKTYGINILEYERMYVWQDGKCAICEDHHDTLCVDHNHANGEVRGLLCHACNQGIGLLKDSPSIIGKAITYLNDNGHYGPEAAASP